MVHPVHALLLSYRLLSSKLLLLFSKKFLPLSLSLVHFWGSFFIIDWLEICLVFHEMVIILLVYCLFLSFQIIPKLYFFIKLLLLSFSLLFFSHFPSFSFSQFRHCHSFIFHHLLSPPFLFCIENHLISS